MTHPQWRIGNQTYRDVPWRDPLDFACGQGFDAFEFFSDAGRGGWCEDAVDAAGRRELKELSAATGLLFSVHAPYAADLSSESGLEAIVKSLSFARDVGAGVVNAHLFPNRSAESFADVLTTVCDLLKPLRFRLSLENTPDVSPEYVNAVFAAVPSELAAAATPKTERAIGLCFDMGHANLHASTRHNYCGWLDRLGQHVPILHWHAHENWGEADSHLPLFTGPSQQDDAGIRGVVRRLAARRFSGSVVLEQWPQPASLLTTARDRLRSLILEECSTTAVETRGPRAILG